MGFSFTINRRLNYGQIQAIYGTFTNDGGSTGGTIATGLRTIENFTIQNIAASVGNASAINAALVTIANAKVIETSMPQGNVAIVTPANAIGFWKAEGQ